MILKEIKEMTTLEINDSYEGETIEDKVRRIVENNEPITDVVENIYTDRKDGVLPAYNIGTDRFEVTIGAMDIVNKTTTAKREENSKIVNINKQTNSETEVSTNDTQEL